MYADTYVCKYMHVCMHVFTNVDMYECTCIYI